MSENVLSKAKKAREASLKMAISTNKEKNSVLKTLIKELKNGKKIILNANAKDMKKAEREKIGKALLKRLELNNEKFNEIIHEIESVIKQKDLVGKEKEVILLDKGLELSQVTVPLGVICTIFESRPDALIQISSLAIKTGNSVILKGGKEALNTNKALTKIIRKCLEKNKLPNDSVQLIESREAVRELLGLTELIDLIIPRGSNAFVKYIQDNSRISVLGHSDGICHEYVDEFADVDKAVSVCVDAKTQYSAVCNAMETLLVHEKISKKFLGKYAESLGRVVELRADSKAYSILKKKGFDVKKATEKDWKTEYNDLILSIKTVKNLEDAINHINKYGSKHTDGIITKNKKNAERFLREVDSSSVVWNASTRFADGFRYGKGAEVGIATGKIHTRGPSGAEALLTYKYILKGNGNVVADYSGKNARKFLHKKRSKLSR